MVQQDGAGRPAELEDPVTTTVYLERSMRDGLPTGERSAIVREALEEYHERHGGWKRRMVTKEGR